MANSMLLKEEEDRLRAADDAMQQVDQLLSDLVPEASAKEQPIPAERFSVTPAYQFPSRSAAARRN